MQSGRRHLLLLAALLADGVQIADAALLRGGHHYAARPTLRRAPTPMHQLIAQQRPIDPIDVQIIQRQFDSVRELPRVTDDMPRVNQTKGVVWPLAGMGTEYYDIDDYDEPSFRRLFTHKTWKRYTGGSSMERIWALVAKWHYCSVLSSVWPSMLIAAVWATLVTVALPSRLLGQLSNGLGGTLGLQGTAIGLLLVFRTDNAYRRLEEARRHWGRVIYLTREITLKCVVSLDYAIVCDVARYLCAYAWSLRDKLRTTKRRDDILELLLDSEECKWVCQQRSRPLALLARVRQGLYNQLETGQLPPTQHYMIDTDVKELDDIVTSCERLFSSPIPPNMARHGMRSLLLWLLGLPFMLAGQLPWFAVVLCVATTAYIYLGIDELGVQVEQPFKILPLWQLCHLVTFSIEEALASPELPLRVKRERQTDMPDAERYDMDDDDGKERTSEEDQASTE